MTTPMTYGIRRTPGGLLRDDTRGEVIRFASFAEAEAEALRLTREAYSNPPVAGFAFTPVELRDPRGSMRNAEQRLELQEAIQLLGEASPEIVTAVLTLLKQGRGS